MQFKFETAYDREAVTIMAKALRKTARKKRNIRSRVLGVIVAVAAILLTLPLGDREFVLDFRTVLTWLVVAVLVFVLFFEDRINGYVAKKRMLPGLETATVTFNEEGYYSETELGSSEFKYGNIAMIAETEDYFVFIFSQSHAQIYSKKSVSGGSIEEFRDFIKNATGKEILKV